jgi:hypothetical protein
LWRNTISSPGGMQMHMWKLSAAKGTV